MFSPLSRALFLLATAGWGRAAAPHPTVLLTTLENSARPVIKVMGTDPVVEVGGKERRIRSEPVYFAARAPNYGEGTVEFSRVAINSSILKGLVSATDDPAFAGNVVGGATFFDAIITPTVEVRGGFISFLLYNHAFVAGETDAPSPQIILHELPLLAAGVATPVKFTSAVPRLGYSVAYFAQVFAAGGAELRSNFSPLADRYHARVEQVKLATAIEHYRARFARVDHGAVPFVVIKPVLPRRHGVPTAPVMATFSVAENGWITEVRFDGTDDPPLLAALNDSLAGWLFLPRLKAGQPIATRVQMPLKF